MNVKLNINNPRTCTPAHKHAYIGIPMTIPLSVRPARNFPVDIYLLMDLSLSMNDDLENLKLFGDELCKYTYTSTGSAWNPEIFGKQCFGHYTEVARVVLYINCSFGTCMGIPGLHISVVLLPGNC